MPEIQAAAPTWAPEERTLLLSLGAPPEAALHPMVSAAPPEPFIYAVSVLR